MKKQQNKLKIYLSKSKMGSMDTLMQVRDVLSQYENVEILEFSGGTYNTEKLLEANIVLIIPPILPKPYKDIFNIGKGQYVEFLECCDSLNQDIYFLISHDTNQLNVVDIDECDIDEIEKDWKLNYAEVNYSLDQITNLEDSYDFIKKKQIEKIIINKTNKIRPMLCLFKF